jgi:hypothetical protein
MLVCRVALNRWRLGFSCLNDWVRDSSSNLGELSSFLSAGDERAPESRSCRHAFKRSQPPF